MNEERHRQAETDTRKRSINQKNPSSAIRGVKLGDRMLRLSERSRDEMTFGEGNSNQNELLTGSTVQRLTTLNRVKNLGEEDRRGACQMDRTRHSEETEVYCCWLTNEKAANWYNLRHKKRGSRKDEKMWVGGNRRKPPSENSSRQKP